MRKIKRALISVWDKTGLIDFSRGLNKLGIEIIATGGTKKKLKDAGIPVIPVSDIIDFPEILGGRVKSMHPVIQAGLLALRDNKQHMEQLKKHNIKPIDMVVSNLYPFSEVIKKDKVKLKEVLDFIDIGGPTMIRAAAKNYKHVVVITNPGQYDKVLEKLKKGDLNEKTRIKLAVEAFRLTAEYDARIDEFLQKHVGVETLPDVFSIKFKKTQDLRYGENPHQKGALYTGFTTKGPSVANAKQLHGKKMSYLNYLDANAAFELVKEFKEPTVAVIKHTSPCGLGCGKTVLEAFEKAYSSDPISAFGGVVSCNRKIDVVTAKRISEIFFHVLIAPGYEKGALEFLKKRKPKNSRDWRFTLKTKLLHYSKD
jgi:phosphoribosylaminoimidazolecarboxamide formyltransferase/IMP cyclohydrolase